MDSNTDTITRYHEATKHHPHRYARSLGYMDWATQPDPFRRFSGAPRVALPPPKVEEDHRDIRYEDVFVPGKVSPQPLSAASVGRFFEFSLAISAWKQAGQNRWALRVNPSSGNLHPTEGYCLLPPLEGIHAAPGVYHYAPREHALERRGEFAREIWRLLPPGVFLVGLSSIAWREAWKYGERAFRYCQHDCGHAYLALDVAARLLGWHLTLLDTVGDQSIAAILGLDRTGDFLANEEEIPEMLMAVWFEPQSGITRTVLPEPLFRGVAEGAWFGKAEPLSCSHHDWALIRAVDRATKKPEGVKAPPAASGAGAGFREEIPDRHLPYRHGFSAWQVIRKRRSAVAMDGVTSLERRAFYRMLARVVDARGNLPWQPKVHLALFVHRVEGIAPGLYFLVRDPALGAAFREAFHRHFRWETPPDCPAHLPLYLLQEGDLTGIASNLSCAQDIAGDSAFSTGMIAEFQSSLKCHGPWFYKRLFWETGMIGQLLYLEAEAAGLSGTGIGCFFDDAVHELLGLRDLTFQSLYHFTVGGAARDPRLVLRAGE
uniref:SagB-type dehydrogenase domain-containing protein n=1 Tax=Candidatus Kentrum sp. DK TaxID=2126562 RepID=A0A450S6T0_9GAMM|nr:MAG: SagB-type dehydrogenase domain-containing protein [Candidatus Kentron sp. DK]